MAGDALDAAGAEMVEQDSDIRTAAHFAFLEQCSNAVSNIGM
jgi:hypothetical protein